MLAQPQERTHCTYRKIEPNINEFVFENSSRAAVDDFIAGMTDIYGDAVPGTAGHVLMDSPYGIPPVAYIFAREMVRGFPRKPDDSVKTKVALILPSSPLVKGVEIMLRAFPFLNVRIYQPHERGLAIAWLSE